MKTNKNLSSYRAIAYAAMIDKQAQERFMIGAITSRETLRFFANNDKFATELASDVGNEMLKAFFGKESETEFSADKRTVQGKCTVQGLEWIQACDGVPSEKWTVEKLKPFRDMSRNNPIAAALASCPVNIYFRKQCFFWAIDRMRRDAAKEAYRVSRLETFESAYAKGDNKEPYANDRESLLYTTPGKTAISQFMEDSRIWGAIQMLIGEELMKNQPNTQVADLCTLWANEGGIWKPIYCETWSDIEANAKKDAEFRDDEAVASSDWMLGNHFPATDDVEYGDSFKDDEY